MDQRTPTTTHANAPQAGPRRMAEISHLFLSEVREKQTAGTPRPTRIPPGAFRGEVSVDLTPEEFAEVFDDAPKSDAGTAQFKPVRAVLAHHLGEQMPIRVREFAASFCGQGTSVGVIYANAANIRITRVDCRGDDDNAEDISTQSFNADPIRQVMTELDHDVCGWLIVLPDPRDSEARQLLKQIKDWTLLTGCDHDSIVGGYRVIKGLAAISNPALSVAIYGAETENDVEKTRQKLAGVCEQFLHLHIDQAIAIEPSDLMVEHSIVDAQVATGGGSPWALLQAMVKSAARASATVIPQNISQNVAPIVAPIAVPSPASTVRMPAPTAASFSPEETVPMKIEQATHPVSMPIDSIMQQHREAGGDNRNGSNNGSKNSLESEASFENTFESILDLPAGNTTPAAIVHAVIRGGNALVESPVKAPACDDAVVAVSRDHRLVLIAAARTGLTDLRSIATAYRWMTDNRALIAMALPQFSIDKDAQPEMHLLVDHTDATADLLQPLLASGNVSVQAYRRLRWGQKTGLLLNAA